MAEVVDQAKMDQVKMDQARTMEVDLDMVVGEDREHWEAMEMTEMTLMMMRVKTAGGHREIVIRYIDHLLN